MSINKKKKNVIRLQASENKGEKIVKIPGSCSRVKKPVEHESYGDTSYC